MRTIYKYLLKVGSDNTFEGARLLQLLHVEPVGETDRMHVWCLVDTGDTKGRIEFQIRGTGHPVAKNLIHGGTACMPSGLVWHVFVSASQFGVELK